MAYMKPSTMRRMMLLMMTLCLTLWTLPIAEAATTNVGKAWW